MQHKQHTPPRLVEAVDIVELKRDLRLKIRLLSRNFTEPNYSQLTSDSIVVANHDVVSISDVIRF